MTSSRRTPGSRAAAGWRAWPLGWAAAARTQRRRHRVALVLLLGLLGLGRAARSQPGATTSIELGELVQGVLSDDDAVDPYRGNWADLYTLEAYAGQRLEILLSSEVVDTYLIVQSPAGTRLAEDDDSGGNLDSRLLLTAPMDGLYTIVATSYSRQEGPYELLVRELHPVPVSFVPLVPGRTTYGSLADTDASRSDSRLEDGYVFNGEAGQQIRLTLASQDFDAYLFLLSPTGEVLAENDDGPGSGTNSAISVQLPQSGQYQVLATSYTRALGDYQLRLEVVHFAEVRDRPITLGRPTAGRLEDGDGTWGARSAYADGYTFEGRAGEQVRVAMTSSDVDSYLVLIGPDGVSLAENDDTGGGLDAALNARLPADGRYRVIATSFELAEGDYLVTVEALHTHPLERQRLRVGEHRSAELSEDDPLRHYDPAHVDLYDLDLDAGQRVVLTMRSQVVNSYLWVVGPTGEVMGEDDDSGGGLDALIELVAPYQGTYLVVATSYPGLTGPYEISAVDANADAASTQVPIGVGEQRSGRLDYGDAIAPVTGSYRDGYTFEGTAGQHVEVRVDSSAIDPYVVLVAPGGSVLAEDDDSGGGLNARVQATLPSDGTYVVWATSYSPAVGDYTVSLQTFEPQAVAPVPIAVGQVVNGSLDLTDARSQHSGSLVDVYRLDGEQGQRLRVTMESAALDSYVLVIDPNGETLGEDDDSGGGLNARLDITLPMSGAYRVLATSGSYATGSYRLQVEPAPPAAEADPFGGP